MVGRGCVVDETVAVEACIDDGATCGPRAYLRPGAHLCEGAKAGTHVEIKKSTVLIRGTFLEGLTLAIRN